jgi:hypothetical protein
MRIYNYFIIFLPALAEISLASANLLSLAADDKESYKSWFNLISFK